MSTQSPDTSDEPDEPETRGDDRPATTRGELRARLVPSLGRSGATVTVDVYIVSGRHGILRVPESFCRECHVFTRRADQAAERVDADVEVRVFSWWTRFLGALRHGGYHPPVMVVGGRRLCQGRDVPTTDGVVAAIEAALDRNSEFDRSRSHDS